MAKKDTRIPIECFRNFDRAIVELDGNVCSIRYEAAMEAIAAFENVVPWPRQETNGYRNRPPGSA